jgi:hypothetical protein
VTGGPLQFGENKPLRMVPTYVDTDFSRGTLSDIMEVPQDGLGQSHPNFNITLGDWRKAKGWVKVKCFRDGTANVKMWYWNMIPNGLYTAWQTMGTDSGGLTAVPLGGAPNVMVPDSKGRVFWERDLNACPFDTQPGTKPVLLYEIAYHSDALIYGGIPDSAPEGLPFGLQTNTHLNVLIKGERN